MAKVLILDQSKSVRNILRERLEYEGFSAEAVEDEAAATDICGKVPFDLIISDTGCKVPDAGIPFIALSSAASIDSAVKAVRSGAQDFLTKPIDMNRLLQSIHRTIANPATAPPAAAAAPVVRRSRRAHPAQAENIIGISPEIEHVRQLIDKVAPCEARVLITGENGTGKELVARWLHAKSARSAAPFVEVNCAAIPSELIESELFGHERGAFTSAIKQRKGKFEQADGGTLFMDEIGDMSLAAQAKVLRALQENKICRVGSDTAQSHRPRCPGGAAADAVDGQHPRTAQRRRAAHHPLRRPHHGPRRERVLLGAKQQVLVIAKPAGINAGGLRHSA